MTLNIVLRICLKIYALFNKLVLKLLLRVFDFCLSKSEPKFLIILFQKLKSERVILVVILIGVG